LSRDSAFGNRHPGGTGSGAGLAALLDDVTARLGGARIAEDLRLDHGDGRRRAWLFAQGVVDSESRDADGLTLSVRWTADQSRRFRDL